MKNWNQTDLGDINEEEQAAQELKEFNEKVRMAGLLEQHTNREIKLAKELEVWDALEELLWKQISRICWLKEGLGTHPSSTRPFSTIKFIILPQTSKKLQEIMFMHKRTSNLRRLITFLGGPQGLTFVYFTLNP